MKKFCLALFVVLLWPLISKSEMNSANYTIYADNFSIGGDIPASGELLGGNYQLFDSVGEWNAGFPLNANYEIRAGFQAMEIGELKLVIDNGSLNLGALDVTKIVSSTTNISVISGAQSGYILSIGSADPSPITAVADGEVTAGSEEYGVEITGDNANFITDEAINPGLVLASSTAGTQGDYLVFKVKAARNSTTNYGSKSQNITLNLSANF